MFLDEGPSDDDLDRFGGDTGYCPKCGEEIWDAAEFCPTCGEHIGGEVSTRQPVEQGCRNRWFILIIITLLIAFLLVVLRP